MTRAIEDETINSRVSDSRAAPVEDTPCPRAIAVSMTDFGSPAHYVPFFAVARTDASPEFNAGSGPYNFVA